MNDILFLFLSLSLSGSFLALILLVFRPILRNRLSQTWQYYIWIVVIMRLLLPFTPEVSIVGGGIQSILNTVSNAAPEAVATNPGVGSGAWTDSPLPADGGQQQIPASSFRWSKLLDNAWMLWLGVALVFFVHKVTSYRSFARFVRAGARKATDMRLLTIYEEIHKEAKLKRQLPLYQNKQVSSPMLVGILKPMVVLPPLAATDDELRGIFRHELTHYRRLDFLYKWLMQITLCLHWFNPLVYLVGIRMNQCCELSCDEAVIRRLDEDSRISYGDALITSLEAQGSYSDFVISITMSENANFVKERLDAIMKYRKQNKVVTVLAALIAVLLFTGGYTLGAYANDTVIKTLSEDTVNNSPAPDMTVPDTKGTVVLNLSNNEGQKNIVHSSSFEAHDGQVLTLEITSNISGTVDLVLFSPHIQGQLNQEHRITFGGSDETKTVNLSEGRWSYNCTGFFDSGDISIVGTIK